MERENLLIEGQTVEALLEADPAPGWRDVKVAAVDPRMLTNCAAGRCKQTHRRILTQRISGISCIGSVYDAPLTASQHSGFFAHSEIILPPAESCRILLTSAAHA